RLRRIIKENHGEKINVLTMGLKPIHENELDLSHLILTVGDKQLNIYDNQNHKDNLDLMCHFKLNEDDINSQGTFYSGCWLRKSKDSLIAFAGDSGIIHIISLAYSQEILRLSGHTGRVIQLIPHPIYEHLLLSVSEDHTIRVWNLELKSTIAIINVDATVACFNPKGSKIITGSSTGEIKFIKLPIMLFNQTNNVRLSITKSIPLLKQSLHGD
ncbi:WD40 repeat-like protein, partial [Neoconidiobolus thromboides FSU 785]